VLARYGIGTSVSSDALPWATVAINVAGSLALGFLVAVGHSLSADVRAALAIGFLGGFTTFSTFAVDVFLDLESGRGGEALAYLAASVLLGVAAAGGGYFAGRALAH
jgi:CrcB protein